MNSLRLNRKKKNSQENVSFLEQRRKTVGHFIMKGSHTTCYACMHNKKELLKVAAEHD
jgi:hypothetical protein